MQSQSDFAGVLPLSFRRQFRLRECVVSIEDLASLGEPCLPDLDLLAVPLDLEGRPVGAIVLEDERLRHLGRRFLRLEVIRNPSLRLPLLTRRGSEWASER